MKKTTLLTIITSIIFGWSALFFLILISIENNEDNQYCTLSNSEEANWTSQNNPCVLNQLAIIQDYGLGIIIFPLLIFIIFLPILLLLKALIQSSIDIFKFRKG